MGAEILDYVQIGGTVLVCVIIMYIRYQIAALEARNAEIEGRLMQMHKKLQ
jgi:hypothetical protein